MSKVRIDFHRAAVAELEEAMDWYAERSADAAKAFAIALDLAVAKISTTPERFSRLDQRHRTCSIDRFPFQVVYRLEEGRVVVIAVVHAKRRPDYWRDRE